MNTVLLRVLDIVSVTGFHVCIFWMYVYHRRAPWWRSDIGRNQMVKLAALAGLFSMRCVELIFGGPFPGELLFAAVLGVSIVAVLVWRFDIMLRMQGDGHN